MGYWVFWRRGWWAMLFMVAINVIATALFFLCALIMGSEGAYFVAAVIIALVVLVPLSGWLFEVFAANSTRLVNRASSGIPAE